MAVTARRTLLIPVLLAAALPLSLLKAAENKDLLEPVGRMANGLSSNNSGDALSAVDKSLPGYEQLRGYLDALSDSFLVSNEVHPLAQNVSGDAGTMTVQWSLTMTSQATDENRRHSATIHIRFARRKNKWKIVEINPLSFFDPSGK